MTERASHDALDKQLSARLSLLLLVALVMWGLLAVKRFLPAQLESFTGIRPQATEGLLGIPLAPLFHHDPRHLFHNTLPFLVLGTLVLVRSWRDFLIVSVLVVAVSGLGVWYFGSKNEVHLGASGLIFGYFGFLLSRGLFERSLIAIAIALAVGFYYGGLMWSIFGDSHQISWQAHLFGFLAGIICGKLLARRRR
jgi:membrane associated rhomboid family serine protease